MPQTVLPHPILITLKRQAASALTSLQQEIAQRERELTELKAEAARWQSMVRGHARVASTTAVSSPTRARQRPRLDWNAILRQLPATFTAQEVVATAGKPIEQIYTHVSRWKNAKKIRKVANGYQKGAPPSRPLSATRSDTPR